MLLDIGTRLNNRYIIEKVIAQGGMGAIYLANDESLNVKVAVKENIYPSEESARQFRREASILAGLRHQNLPRVTDHFILPNQGQYLVMDYIEGEDLHDRLETFGSISETEAITIGASVCDALTYLHNRQPPVIHRDIKPGNIKIAPDGTVYLVDFGLAKQNQPGQATTTGAQALTPGYAPPEQYGEGTDVRSDIYSLAATLYTAICKNIPEDGMARLLGNATLTPVQIHNKAISDQTAHALEKALSIKRDERFFSALEFKNSLTASRPLEPIKTILRADQGLTRFSDTRVSRPLTPPNPVTGQASPGFPRPYDDRTQKTGGQAKNNKAGVIPYIVGGFFVLLVFTVITIIITGKFLSKPAHTPEAPTPISLALPLIQTEKPVVQASPVAQKTDPPPVITQTTEKLQSPQPTSGSTPTGGNPQIAYASTSSGTSQVWLFNNDGSNPIQLTKMSDGACQPDWSPDGSKIVFTSPCKARQDIYKGSSLFIMNADGSKVFPLPSIPGGDFDPAWSPDGTHILFTSLRDGNVNLYQYTLSDYSVTRITDGIAQDRRASWSPDGKKIAFERYQTRVPMIWIMEIGNKAQPFTSESFAGIMPHWSPAMDVLIFSQGSTLPWLAAKRINAPGSPDVRLSDFRPVYNAIYSRDGFWIVFEGQVDGRRNVFRMMSNGSDLLQLTRNEGENYQPRWRPLP